MRKKLRFNLSVWLVLLLSYSCAFAQSNNPDECEVQIPMSLRDVVQAQFPSYRIARVSDYSKEDIEQHKAHFKGNPCLAVASADVDGDGFTDLSFLIVDESKHTLLVAARNPLGKTWKLERLADFGPEGPGSSYVETIEPGAICMPLTMVRQITRRNLEEFADTRRHILDSLPVASNLRE